LTTSLVLALVGATGWWQFYRLSNEYVELMREQQQALTQNAASDLDYVFVASGIHRQPSKDFERRSRRLPSPPASGSESRSSGMPSDASFRSATW